MSDETLRLQAREAIRNKRIPDRRPERMWGGAAGSDHCTICGSRVGDLGLDLESGCTCVLVTSSRDVLR